MTVRIGASITNITKTKSNIAKSVDFLQTLTRDQTTTKDKQLLINKLFN
jgi:hypothetical protein